VMSPNKNVQCQSGANGVINAGKSGQMTHTAASRHALQMIG